MIVKIDKASQQINQISQILKNGGMIAMPTDTIYGLAVDAIDEHAVKRLFSAKKRSDKRFTIFTPKSRIGEFGPYELQQNRGYCHFNPAKAL